MQNIIIIGAGFSGTLTAIHLLRRQHLIDGDFHITLINRYPEFGKGVAYGSTHMGHILNVPVGNMSAFVNEPDHFLQYCQLLDPSITQSSFVSRKIYGDYLHEILLKAISNIGTSAHLTCVVGEVVDLQLLDSKKMCVYTSDGQTFSSDIVVLASGNQPPQDLNVEDTSFYHSDQYISNPWDKERIDQIGSDDAVLLIGTGLTAIDMCASLDIDHRTGPIYLISRHGLIPQSHRPARSSSPTSYSPNIVSPVFQTVRSAIRELRTQIKLYESQGDDWRELFATLRPHTKKLWQQLSHLEKIRFLRHLRTYWDNHRHRVAPEPFQRFQQAQKLGKVAVIAGRIQSFSMEETSVLVQFLARGSQALSHINVSHVINCTGPCNDLSNSKDILSRQLIKNGLLSMDSVKQGIIVDANNAVIDQSGNASKQLFYIGPLLKAQYWEATAVPELRVFTEELANHIVDRLNDN